MEYYFVFYTRLVHALAIVTFVTSTSAFISFIVFVLLTHRFFCAYKIHEAKCVRLS